jgi:hypothetical protein
MGPKNCKILLFIVQYAARLKNITFLSNIKVAFHPTYCSSQLQPLDLGIIHAFKCHYRKQLIRKTVAMIDGGLLRDAVMKKLDVLTALLFIVEAWRSVTHTAIKNCFVKCGFSYDHVSSNDYRVVKLKEDEEEDEHILQPCGMQFGDYTDCENALEVCGIQSVNQVLDQHLTRPEEEEEVCRVLSSILGCPKRTGSSKKVLVSILYQEQYYSDV